MALSTLRDTMHSVIAVFGIYNNDLDLREIFEHSLRIVIKCWLLCPNKRYEDVDAEGDCCRLEKSRNEFNYSRQSSIFHASFAAIN